jgi:hypothetical protein
MIETLKIECPATEDNPAGFYVINAEDKAEGMVEFKEKSPDDMTVAELRDALTAAGVEFPDNAKKADLAALLASLGA